MTVRVTAALLIALAALIFAAPGAGPTDTEAVFPGTNGRISFALDGPFGGFALSTMNPDGTDSEYVEGAWQVTAPLLGSPEWSPDGTEIAYFPANEGVVSGIGIAAADGSGIRAVPNNYGGFFPTWSPDGSMIAFSGVEDDDVDIFTIKRDGTDVTRVTNTPAEKELYLDWSPDGQQIAFAAGGSESQWDIKVVDLDGSNRRNITDTPGASEIRPSWAPDGEHLIFERDTDESIPQIARVDADGQSYTILTGSDLPRRQPAYSPDGQKIAFTYYAVSGIGVMDADGSNEVQISDQGYLPDWGTHPVTAPSDLLWGDNNCSGAADPVDALLTMRFDVGLPANTGECPAMGEVVGVVGASAHPWGDVDCSGSVNPVDSLKLLRFDAGLSVSQAGSCPLVGSEVQLVAG